ncbi:MAG: GNAT family N-acetyltransferase [Candidatus Peribacteraceae bacterium]|jgi:ribosomal-protein-alanine N-acetyltransferase
MGQGELNRGRADSIPEGNPELPNLEPAGLRYASKPLGQCLTSIFRQCANIDRTHLRLAEANESALWDPTACSDNISRQMKTLRAYAAQAKQHFRQLFLGACPGIIAHLHRMESAPSLYQVERLAEELNAALHLAGRTPSIDRAPPLAALDTINHQQESIRVFIRNMIYSDLNETLETERDSFAVPKPKHEFIAHQNRKHTLIVAEYGERNIGHMIFNDQPKHLTHLLSLAVRPIYRRLGVGSQMVAYLLSTLRTQRKSRIILEISDGNFPGMIFFRSCGFRVVNKLNDYFEWPPYDAYVMSHHLEHEETTSGLPVQELMRIENT